jgi:DNA-binding HxlR family transcriptional regulator
MSPKGNISKYYSLYKPSSSTNGLKYDKRIDVAIINELNNNCESISSSDLKRRIERILNHQINSRTYSDHLKRMLKENLLYRHDTGDRGKTAVFYSLTKESKRKKQLKLLSTDPQYGSFKKIYANLFFKAITEPEIYSGTNSNLDQLLSDINASRKDLKIDHIKKEYFNGNSYIKNVNEPEKRILPIALVIYYKPISNVNITETTIYYENIRTHLIWEGDSWYDFAIPGISMKGFCNNFYAFKPKPDDVEKAFLLLLKNNLIKPIMEFRGETRYILADKILYDLITDIKLLVKIQRDVDYILDQYEPPSLEQIEKRKILYSDD